MYRFAKKYGANVDGYSPIYTPDTWSESGNEYKLGSKGLLAWCDFIDCTSESTVCRQPAAPNVWQLYNALSL